MLKNKWMKTESKLIVRCIDKKQLNQLVTDQQKAGIIESRQDFSTMFYPNWTKIANSGQKLATQVVLNG